MGHVLCNEGIHRGPKVNALNQMPVPHGVSTLHSFLGSVQWVAPTFSSVAEPLYRFIRKGHRCAWRPEEEAAFRRLKELLSAADVLAHFDPSLPLGVACDASAVGIGATLFHRYSDGSERPIGNISKTLTVGQRNYILVTQNLVILPGCPKEKRTPPFPSSSRATLRQRPPGNRRRHKTLARNMDRAILGNRNGRENLKLFCCC